MTVGLLNTAAFQCLKYQDQRICNTYRSIFIFWSSRNLWVWLLYLACQGVTGTPAPRKLRHWCQ